MILAIACASARVPAAGSRSRSDCRQPPGATARTLRMNVLVTGGAGFIGSHLAEALARRGDRVRVLDNFATGSRENVLRLGDDVELIEGDLRSYERAHNAVR